MNRLLLVCGLVLLLAVPHQPLKAQCGWAIPTNRLNDVAADTNAGIAYQTGARTRAYNLQTGETLWDLNLAGQAILADPTAPGHVYVAGVFRDSLLIDTTYFQGRPGSNLFVVRLQEDAAIFWLETAGAQVDTTPTQGTAAWALDWANGDIVVGGQFRDTLIWQTDTLVATRDTTDSLAPPQPTDAYWANVQALTGTVLATTAFGGPHNDRLNALYAAPGGQVYATGRFTDSAFFPAGDTTRTLRANQFLTTPQLFDFEDVFLAAWELASPDSTRWEHRLGAETPTFCPGDDGLAVHGFGGHVYVGGTLHPNAIIGADTVPDTTLINLGPTCARNGFVASFTTDGRFDWATVLGPRRGDRTALVHDLWAADSGVALFATIADTTFITFDTLRTDTLLADTLGDVLLEYLDTLGRGTDRQLFRGANFDAAANLVSLGHKSWLLGGVFNDTLTLDRMVLRNTQGFNRGWLARLQDSVVFSLGYPSEVALACGDTVMLPTLDSLLDTTGVQVAWEWPYADSLALYPELFAFVGDTAITYTAVVPGCDTLRGAIQVRQRPRELPLAFRSSDTIVADTTATIQFTNLTPNADQYSFTWFLGNGDSSTLLAPSVEYEGPDTFSVTLVGELMPAGCRDTLIEEDFIILQRPVGTADGTPMPELRLYPNPARVGQRISVEWPGMTHLMVHNAVGSRVADLQLPPYRTAFQLPTDRLTSGLYFLTGVSATGERTTARITLTR